MNLSFSTVLPSLPFLLEGVLVNLKYACLSFFLALGISIVVALLKVGSSTTVRWLLKRYTDIFRGTPLILTLSLVYFGTPQLFGYQITAFESGLIAFTLNAVAYLSEVFRAGIESVAPGQTEAAKALHIGKFLLYRDIILPQAVRNVFPSLMNETINLLKDTALVSVIGESDLLKRAHVIASKHYIYFEPLMVVAVVYFLMIFMLSSAGKMIELRLKKT